MTDPVLVACITVGGVIAGASISAIIQLKITKHVLGNEYNKIITQVRLEAISKRNDKKRELLLQAVPELLEVSDPDIHVSIDYGMVVRKIHKIQILLNLKNPSDAQLNAAVNDLGLMVSGYLNRQCDKASLLRSHAAITDTAREVCLAI
ncbi:MAG: hypothetical protein PHY48_09545 [Candidatus Cloacimonetes bacterium]|nr:hypothetical protein [Candidatus Cloacimonadota bacterium]